jgi:hypothetical protein
MRRVRQEVQVLEKADVLQRQLLDGGANAAIPQKATGASCSANGAKQAQKGKVTVGCLRLGSH